MSREQPLGMEKLHPGVKPEFYLAMLETAREVGYYPIDGCQLLVEDSSFFGTWT
jgi:hypothetical protein